LRHHLGNQAHKAFWLHHDQVSFFPFIFLWDDVMLAGRLVTQIYEQRNGNTRHGNIEDREHMEG
jgi:hypothetical protein